MAAKEITIKRYRCVCERPNCPGKGRPWISEEDKIPERCCWCKHRTWNGKNVRKKSLVGQQVIEAALSSGATSITLTNTDASGKVIGMPMTIPLPKKATKASTRSSASIALPKPRKVRGIE